MIKNIECPHCRGEIELSSNTNEIVKIPKDMIENLKNGTLGIIRIDENLQVVPVYPMKNIRVRFEPNPKKNLDEIMDKEIDDYFDNQPSYRAH